MVNLSGGSLFGNQGTVSGPVLSNAAINIGDNLQTIGQLNFIGNYTQGANGSLTFDIAGSPATGLYDQLNIGGHAQLGGWMIVDLLHGFVPQIGDEYDIMNFSGASGDFVHKIGLAINGQEHFVLEWNPTSLELEVAQGPQQGIDLGSEAPLTANVWSNGVPSINSVSGDTSSGNASSGSTSSGNAKGRSGNGSAGQFSNGGPGTHDDVALNLTDAHQSTPTPEPGTILLMGSGLLCVGYGLRRRMSK